VWASSPGEALQIKGRVAKKFALYPPKEILDRLGLREGQIVAYELTGRELVVKPIEDPLELATKSKKWAKTTVKEFEEESQREQNEFSS
jgi:bifunctional DNA-binding transcriptional regulator/antitoxin component of YhaV-PrlF toxin-antitoxin module